LTFKLNISPDAAEAWDLKVICQRLNQC